MADINQIITLGIGTPADVPHFILVGLSPTGVLAVGDGDPITVSIRAAGRTVTMAEADRTMTVRALGRTIEIGAKPT